MSTAPRVLYLPGDGIGPPVLASARRVLEAAGFETEFVEAAIGWEHWRRDGEALPAETLRLARETDCAWFGAVTSKPPREAEVELAPRWRGRGRRYESPIVRLRRELDLFANVRPCLAWPGNPANLREGVDLVVVRENTEDLYAGVELRPVPPSVREALREAAPAFGPFAAEAPDDLAASVRVTTRRGVTRAAEHAFVLAARRRGRVAFVEKANVLRATGGLAVEAVEEVARRHPDVVLTVESPDAAAMGLVRRPEAYDVLLATNLLGDILSDLAAAVTGSIGLAPSANVGHRYALFEPVHGSAPDLSPGTANPLAAVLSGAMMLDWLGRGDAARRVRAAVGEVVARGPRTPDMGGSASTTQVERALAEALRPVARH